MGDYRPIYSYAASDRNLASTRRRPTAGWLSYLDADRLVHRRCLPILAAALALVAFSTVLFLSIDEVTTLKRTWKPAERPATDLSPGSDTIPPASAADTAKMPPSLNTDSLDAFLTQAKSFALQRLGGSGAASSAAATAATAAAADSVPSVPITLVMGNEAGDLDSAASAISLSFLLSRFGPPEGHQLPQSTYLPLIQSNHDDAVLRPENTAAFHASRIDPAHLLCLDDLQHHLGLSLDSPAFSPEAGVSIALVDHPSLTGPWGGPKASHRRVEIIVDHHEDTGDHADAKMRIVKPPSKEPVGSAASMVANLYRENLVSGAAPKELADLLISAIVIDTDNLRPAPRGKATQADFDAVKLLLPVSSFAYPDLSQQVQLTAFQHSPLNMSTPPSTDIIIDEPAGSSPSADAASSDRAVVDAKSKLRPFWEVLVKSKLMVSHLSGRDLLRRDYKELDFVEPASATPEGAKLSLRLGFASVPIGLAEWLHKDRPQPSLQDVADPKAEVDAAWADWWKTLDAFMEERKIDLAVMTGSFRDAAGGGEGKEGGKHKRELVLAFAPRSLAASDAEAVWASLRDGLEADAHVASPDDVERRLMLEQPWKGQRLPERAGGKRERVAGLDADGRRRGGSQPASPPRWAKVYKQANARANRKIVLPAVVAVLRNAASAARL
ncbi:uncharacterized protein PFL1_04344 [Pseudozyma flocculosa PF-1]|uniref:Related to PPX1 - exopolyphosphatase n=2 Tax=Pseudozyma flocculosa TaxID=84751 RepID=A0A5C3FBF5_9BASI|nr:uncharacterized protein PFL1_04344 [Pseudozyma flocculosa PF-1]EPQ28017.1 hypothetical protein PFL1_04344 [Pseudozyma flocculosa PF-1]SPO41590.1 related to PPX1 - exopolyphosphatase [Pseudozyma flocculosa]